VVLDIGGPSLRMLSGEIQIEGGVGGPNALRVPLYGKVWSSKSVAKSSPRVPHTPRNPGPIVPETFRGEARGDYKTLAVESRAGPRLREIRRDQKGDRVDYIQISR